MKPRIKPHLKTGDANVYSVSFGPEIGDQWRFTIPGLRQIVTTRHPLSLLADEIAEIQSIRDMKSTPVDEYVL
jgi:hypothetical protein